MHIQNHMRTPGVEAVLQHQPRLLLREHEPVAVVVVPRVVLVQKRRHNTLV